MQRSTVALCWVLVAVVVAVLLSNAWVSDDAFITFRSVEQLHAGNGARWNPHERVQAYTHPLWFLLLALVRIGCRNLFAASLVLSLALSLGTIALAYRVLGGDRWRWLWWIVLLLSCKTFVDYTTSGLETPLVFLLLSVFVLQLQAGLGDGETPSLRRIATLVTVACLLVLCRHDLVLLVTPALLVLLVRSRDLGWARVSAVFAAGLAPLAVWTAFSLVYYGFPFPNTAYAKLGTGVPPWELWRQGWIYLGNLVQMDPLAALLIGLGVLAAMRLGTVWGALGVGAAAYTGYVLKVGGDFMAGRFFAPVLLLGSLAVVRWWPWEKRVWVGAGALLIYAVVVPGSPWLVGPGYRALYANLDAGGIQDEKGLYFAKHSLWARLRGSPERTGFEGSVVKRAVIGYEGYCSLSDQIIIDENGLADPLLSRLPSARPWRIGHFPRALPAGYLESVQSGENRIVNPHVRALYDEVRTVTTGPLLSRGRWRAMLRLNLDPPRFSCADPPCRSVRAIVDPHIRPLYAAQNGAIETVRQQGRVVVVEGWLPLGDLESDQEVLVSTPTRLASVVLEHKARPDLAGRAPSDDPWTPGFLLRLRYPSEQQAAAAAAELCISYSSQTTRPALVASDSQHCRAFLWPEARP